ncbi:MAG: ATP-binding protein, partial [Candidatus Omnitrophota bacterium]
MGLYVVTSVLTALTGISVGTFVFSKNPKGPVNRTWFGLSTSLAFWSIFLAFMFNSKTAPGALLYARISQIGLILLPALHLHFIISLLNYSGNKRRIVYLCYSISVIFLIYNFTPYLVDKALYANIVGSYYPQAGPLYSYYIIFYTLAAVYTLYLMLKSFASEKGLIRNQIAYLLTFSVAGFAAVSSTFPLSYGVEFAPVGIYFMWLYVLTMAIVIVRYQLTGISIAVTRIGIFLLVYLIILGIPFLVADRFRPLLIENMGQSWWLFPLLLMVVFAASGPFLFYNLERKAEIRLRKKEILAHKALNRLALNMMRFTRLETLLKLIVHHVVKIMRLDCASIYLKDEISKDYCLKATRSASDKTAPLDKFSQHSSLVQDIILRRVPIRAEELRYSLVAKLSPHIKKLQNELGKAKAVIIIPAFKKGSLFGFLALGAKRDNSIFTQDDVDTFATLTEQSISAIENAHSYEELINTRDQLIKVERLATLGKFSSEVAHEIKNPLQGIKAFAELITQKYDDEGFREKFSRLVTTEIDRIDKFVRQLVKVSHPLLPNFGTVDLNKSLDSVLELMSNDLENNNISVKKQYEIPPISIEADKDQMKQVFLNLIANAMDAMKSTETKTLALSTSSSSSQAVIRITDTGCGIPKDSLHSLFNPMFTTKEKGSGLGLSIVDTIIRNHKGKITVESETGKCTTFTITIP